SRASGAARVEALRPDVPTGTYGCVYHGEGWGRAIRRKAFLVEVEGDARHVRRPRLLDHLRGIVEGSRGGIGGMSMDTAVLAHVLGDGRTSGWGIGDGRAEIGRACGQGGVAGCVGRHAKLDPIALAGHARPTLGVNPGWIEAAGGICDRGRARRASREPCGFR